MRQLSRILFIGIAAVLCSSCSAQTNPEDHKALVRRWIDQGFNNKDLSVVEEVISPDAIINGQRIGHLGLKNSMSRFITAFPNLKVTITEAVAEGDRVAISYTVEGNQTSVFEGIPATGRQVRWIGADFFRIVNGKIIECRFVDDSLGLLRQLGATVSVP